MFSGMLRPRSCFPHALTFSFVFIVLVMDAAGQARAGFSTAFRPPSHTSASVDKAVVQPDGRILIRGLFLQVDLEERMGMARLHDNGSVDLSFVPVGDILDFVLQPDGKVVVHDRSGSGRTIRRLNSDGSLDATFPAIAFSNGSLGATVRAFAIASDGKILVGGDFNTIAGVTRHNLARINTDGTIDQTFPDVNPTTSSPQPFIYGLSVRPDGKLLVGGRFDSIAGLARTNMVLLNSDGTADSSFDAGLAVNQHVNRITQVEDGKLLIAGGLSTTRRVLANGALDASFAPPAGTSNCMPQLPGKYVCTGLQRTRLNAVDGSVDPTFAPFSGGALVHTVLQDGKLLIHRFGPADILTRLTANGTLDDPASAPSDFNGDLKTDLSVFRPSTGQWYTRTPSGWYTIVNWGVATDQIVPADYDGDAVTDYAVFREADSNWYMINSSDNTFTIDRWGEVGDVALAADYDGDRKAERVIYRPSDRKLYILSTKYGVPPIHPTIGIAGDRPLIGDFDGDNLTDSVVYRPSTGLWMVQMTTDPVFEIKVWGQSGDIPVPGDYDGDDITDYAVYRPSTQEWWHRTSSSPNTFVVRRWGEAGDIPTPGDYDGDRIADRAIFRPSTNTWHVLGSQVGWQIVQFGETGDIPTNRAQ